MVQNLTKIQSKNGIKSKITQNTLVLTHLTVLIKLLLTVYNISDPSSRLLQDFSLQKSHTLKI